MAKLIVLILHYFKEILIPLEKDLSDKLILKVNKLKQNWKLSRIDIPEFGYQGMEIRFNDQIKIFVYEENIIYSNDNLIQLLHDPKKIVYNHLLKIASKNHYKELIYFHEVRKYRKIT